MCQFPSQEVVQMLRKQYPKETRVELISLDDPHVKLAPGTQGTVLSVDDTGTIFVRWDCGPILGVVCGVDSIKMI